MSQHDFTIANATFPATRTDLNLALAALASTSLGTTAPSTTFAGQLWYDSTNDALKIRNEADDAWITLFSINQTTAKVEVGDENSRVESRGALKRIYNTRIRVSSTANGSLITLTDNIEDFDYLEFIMAEQDGHATSRYFTTVKIPRSVIPASLTDRISLVNGSPSNALLAVAGSGTSLRVKHIGNEVTHLYAILGVTLDA